MEKMELMDELQVHYKDFVKRMKGRVSYDDYETQSLLEGYTEELASFISKELDKAREEGRMSAMNELKRAFSKVFYKSGELWFDYLFEDGDTEAEEDAKAVVEGYWEDILSELKDKN
jgi:hypothetical protein